MRASGRTFGLIGGWVRRAAWTILVSAGCAHAQAPSRPAPAAPGPGMSLPAGQPAGPADQPAALAGESSSHASATVGTISNAATGGLRAWEGLPVEKVEFRGVSAEQLEPLVANLELQPGQKLSAERVRQSLRSLYATGLYETLAVEGYRSASGVVILFSGQSRRFIGTVSVDGVKWDLLTSQLERAARLTPGTRFTEQKLANADRALLELLNDNGFYQSRVSHETSLDAAHQLVNTTFHVTLGARARIGEVTVQGDSGLTESQFRKRAKMKKNRKVTRETASRALSSLGKYYKKQNRLEAEVHLESHQFQAAGNRLNYAFRADRGPIVEIVVNGAKLSRGKMQRYIPVYEEGAVDDDLLNEGSRNLRDYFQRQGYFDVEVSHQEETLADQKRRITFFVRLGPVHKVDSVRISGNRYFDERILAEHLSVHKADLLDRHGLYSQSLVNADVGSITAMYQSNGFLYVKVDPVVRDTDEHQPAAAPAQGKKRMARLSVEYRVTEGAQQTVGSVSFDGVEQVSVDELKSLMNTQAGQPYSPANLAGDRDVILSTYLSRGFDKATVEAAQQASPEANKIDVTLRVYEGTRVFVRDVIITGMQYTRPAVVLRDVEIRPGQPLNETALYNIQRNLYDLALFSEVNTNVQNPAGQQARKNVLLGLQEARRWDISYGFGFEAQTGTPSKNCPSPAELALLGLPPNSCSPNGKTGASPRVLFDITRTNLFGRDQSLSLRTNYGLLEQLALLSYQNPRLRGDRNFGLTVSGGYTNSQNVTTYAASILQAQVSITEHFLNEREWLSKANTFLYQFTYRRVEVDPGSIQVSVEQIPLLSQPTRVGGPGFTWIRDTRDAPLDAHRGTYLSSQEFLAASYFGSEANFNRLDITHSSYYAMGTRNWVLARSTRFGYERAFGPADELTIPLPERLYAGGSTSHRGFSINSAGPRDPQTGYPIGGAGAFVNSLELRMPAPTLPYVGTSLGFVLFHDMGNVFKRSSDIWPSFGRVKQPHSQTCRDLSDQAAQAAEQGVGNCDFADFSHAAGLGLRYKTPIGPVRIDLSYNLNPPIYPIFYDYSNSSNPLQRRVGQANHFNFFFSLGQSF